IGASRQAPSQFRPPARSDVSYPTPKPSRIRTVMTSMPEQTATVESAHLPTADEVVLGVDTHKDEHVAAVVTALGLLVATASFPATAVGYEELLAWAEKFGLVRRAGVEGTGSYGAALARHLRARGVTVIEVNRPDRSMRRHRGKTDAV